VNTVIDKAKLIAILTENRSKHRQVFEAAVEGYRTEAVRLLEDQISRILAGKVRKVYVVLPAPEDHTRDYNRVLRMLELDERSEVLLDESTFAQLVLDEWRWRQEFLGTASTYAGGTVSEVYATEVGPDQ
jgi:hypothetical protein